MKYRSEPIPGTGCGGWCFGNYYKRPKTTQERKQYIAHTEYARELGVKIRLRKHRSDRSIANAWDDRVKSICGYRSWKRYRKTQYKMKKQKN